MISYKSKHQNRKEVGMVKKARITILFIVMLSVFFLNGCKMKVIPKNREKEALMWH